MCNQQSNLEDTYVTWGFSQATMFKVIPSLEAEYNQPQVIGFICLFLKKFYFYFILLYNTVLVLPYIDMNPPRVYVNSQS